jgi:hypothetical protein
VKGLQVGILITLISAVCYGLSWEAYYRTSGHDFMQQYSAKQIEQMRAKGAPEAEVSETQKQMDQFGEMYKNFFFRFGMTLIEILPVGVIVTLISAALLRKKELLPVASPAME